MKAIVQDRYGSIDVLQLREVDRPVAADNEVLVRVHAAAVNAREWHVMRGDPFIARLMAPAELGLGAPKIRVRGTDFAGRVEAIGRGVTRFRPGDEVFGEIHGAFAEYVCVPDDLVELKPVNLTFEQAAAMPLAANTALMGLRDAGRVQSGQRSIGADHVIDYTRDDFTRNGRRYDVVFDLVGNRSLSDCRRALTPTGTLVLHHQQRSVGWLRSTTLAPAEDDCEQEHWLGLFKGTRGCEAQQRMAEPPLEDDDEHTERDAQGEEVHEHRFEWQYRRAGGEEQRDQALVSLAHYLQRISDARH